MIPRRSRYLGAAAATLSFVLALSPSPAGTRAASDGYLLPAPAGTALTVTTGNGVYHQGFEYYAWDFAVGQAEFQIAAARGGIVKAVREDSSGHCYPESDCWAQANYVLVDHGDRTWGLYLHLKQDHVFVTAGQTIQRGKIIATADNTGFSKANHLHFQVEDPTRCSVTVPWWCQSVPASFSDPDVLAKTSDGVPTAVETYISGNAAAPHAGAVPPAPSGVTYEATGAGNFVDCDSGGAGCFYWPSGGPSPWRLTWQDVANETGYRVYVAYEGWYWSPDPDTCIEWVHLAPHLLAQLPAETTSFNGIWTEEGSGESKGDPVIHTSTYYVVAFNSAGSSERIAGPRIGYYDTVGECVVP